MTNIIDVKKLTASVKADTKALAARLRRSGSVNAVKNVYDEHKGTLDIASALIALARKSADKLAKEEAAELAAELKTLEQAEERAAAGGHPAFDLKISRAAKECWVHLDGATELFSAILLQRGIVDDPVYKSRPTVKSVLRPVLESPPVKKSPPRKAKPGGSKKKKAAGGENSGSQPPSTPPKSPVPPPTPGAAGNPPSATASPQDQKPS